MSSSEETTAPARPGPRRSLLRDERGQIIIFYLIFIIPMVALLFSVYNVGQLVAEKQKIQTAADNAAYSAAVWEARYMNLSAYINRAMVANYDTMAMVLSLWSMIDAWDGFLFLIDFIVEKIPIINVLQVVTKPAHQISHQANMIIGNQVVGGSSQQQRLLYVMEIYNRVLSYAQRALYFLNQGGRKQVIETIAWGVDPKIRYLTWAEILNAISLNSRVKWTGTDEKTGLRLTTERSLNAWSRGASLRESGTNLAEPVNTVLSPLDVICRFFGGGGVKLVIGSEGYKLKETFDYRTGEIKSCKDFNCDANIVQNDKLYQHDFAGISIKLCFIAVGVGHHSDDDYNIGKKSVQAGSSGLSAIIGLPHLLDTQNHVQYFSTNGINCTSPPIGSSIDPSDLDFGGSSTEFCDDNLPSADGCGPGFALLSTNTQQTQTVAACEQSLNQLSCEEPSLPEGCPILSSSEGGDKPECQQYYSDRSQYDACVPAGGFKVPSACGSGYCADPANRDDPSDRGKRLDAAKKCQDDVYAKIRKEGKGGGAFDPPKSQGTGSEVCQTIYKFDTPLKDMEVTTYVPDTALDASLDGRRMQGPTVFVYFEKEAQFLPFFEGPFLPGRRSIGAYSYAKVYYSQRVNDTTTPDNNRKTSNKESVFNPFWGARLERLEPLFK